MMSAVLAKNALPGVVQLLQADVRRHVMADRRHERDRPPALRFRESSRSTRRARASTTTPDALSTAASQKPSVCAMTRMFSSVAPGRTPQRRPTASGWSATRSPGAAAPSPAGRCSISSRAAVPSSRPTREPRHLRLVRSFAAAAPELRREVARNAEDDHDGGGAFVLRDQHRAVRFRRVVERARRRDAVDEHRLAAHVATREVGRRAEADVDGVEIEARRRACRSSAAPDAPSSAPAVFVAARDARPPTTSGTRPAAAPSPRAGRPSRELRSFAATSCCASACAGVPVIRPHH